MSRNVFSHVPATKVRDVSHMLKTIHAQECREAAEQKARAIIENLRASKMSTAADLVEQAVHETLTYYAFPEIHRQKIRTNNPLERIIRENPAPDTCRRGIPRWAVMSQFGSSTAAVHRRHGRSTKRYMNMRPPPENSDTSIPDELPPDQLRPYTFDGSAET
jgi:putative transposase